MDIKKPLDRIFYFTKQVNQQSISDLTEFIHKIERNDIELKKQFENLGMEYNPKPIQIYIDSYGGTVYQCLGLISVMELCTTPIHTIVTGVAMSCGFLILINGHKRFAHKLSTTLYHQVSSAVWGTYQDMEENMLETKRLQKLVEKITIDKTNIKKKKLDEIRTKKMDWYIDAEESKRLGIVDEIL